MTILPSGNPLWLRNSGITQYGGDPNKKDYGGIGVINARTDIGANQHSRMTADLAALARVSALLRMQFTPHAIAPTTSVELCAPAWGPPVQYANGAVPPTTNYPTVTGTGTSRIITLPATAADDFGVVGQLSPKIAMVTGGLWDGTIIGLDSMSMPIILPIALGWGALDIVAIEITITSVTNGVPVTVSVW